MQLTSSLSVLTAIVSLAGICQAQTGGTQVTFLCDRMPEVCTNMCWAVRCANPTFTQYLTWDEPDAAKTKDRRNSAGCQPGGNKCGVNSKSPLHRPDAGGVVYNSCDEYPFASTSDADAGSQVSRCVPKVENSRQGKALMTLYAKLRQIGAAPQPFHVVFANPGAAGVNYCNNEPCNSDGFQIQNTQVSKREEEPLFHFYETVTGLRLASLIDLPIGESFDREMGEGENMPEAHHGNITWSDADGDIWLQDTIMQRVVEV